MAEDVEQVYLVKLYSISIWYIAVHRDSWLRRIKHLWISVVKKLKWKKVMVCSNKSIRQWQIPLILFANCILIKYFSTTLSEICSYKGLSEFFCFNLYFVIKCLKFKRIMFLLEYSAEGLDPLDRTCCTDIPMHNLFG